MARKNSRVQSKRLPRRERGTAPVREKKLHIPRVKVEELIIPDGLCTLAWRRRALVRFDTPEKAQAALEQAQRGHVRTGSMYVEKRYYSCDCGGYHLTSREEYQGDRP